MRFDLDMGEGANQIRGFSPGQIKINENIYTHNIIVAPDSVSPWLIDNFDQIPIDALQEIINLQPDVVLFGTGSSAPVVFQQALLQFFHENKIGVEIMTTAAACRTYNVIMAEGRRVIAVLIIK